MIINKLLSQVVLISLLFSSTFLIAQPEPPSGKKWVKIKRLSDEFNDNKLNASKWINNESSWEGRIPSRFERHSVSVSDGNLKIVAAKKKKPNGKFTHEGGLIASAYSTSYGYYETRMKANKTFQSSTFWLINDAGSGTTACDRRITELDVIETIGINTGGGTWIDKNVISMNSNSHSRSPWCRPENKIDSKCPWPSGCPYTSSQVGNKGDLGGPSWADYHTYGVWYKNKDEATFYLDGKDVGTIQFPSEFNLDLYLRMVVESYDWNPPKAGSDGMDSPLEERTTYYDYVRSYKLVNIKDKKEEEEEEKRIITFIFFRINKPV